MNGILPFAVIFTARKRSCGKIMFLHLSVILFTGGGGGFSVLFVQGGLCPEGGRSLCKGGGSLRRGDSIQGFSVRETTPLYDKEWAVRILLEYILCSACYCMFTLTDTNSQQILMNTMINAAVIILH